MLSIVGAMRPWADPTITALRRLPIRARAGTTPERTLILDGTWMFGLFDSPDDVPAHAVAVAEPTQGQWHHIDVPGSWPMQDVGDIPHYTNIQMPFSEPPPQVPQHNPTGVYRNDFELPEAWTGERIVAHIGAADSTHAVYVNGTFVGYGTDARLSSEYDISDVVQLGTNVLAIVVTRFSAHSFIEDQDGWWLGGLHRTVRIEARPRIALADLWADADWDSDTGLGSLTVRAEIDFADPGVARPGYTVRTHLLALDGTPVTAAVESLVPHEASLAYEFEGHIAKASWQGLEVSPWSAETPTLYRVTAELLDADGAVVDRTQVRVGFRRVQIVGAELLVNDTKVWIFGVNRHDHHPDRGAAVTVQDMREDLIAMRRLNINAVRTSHYPNDPAFYDLCDELGFYVINEANIESHAYNWYLCDDDRYRSAWLERGARMVTRDRNHPCVMMWSLGNESGYGVNHDALAGWIRRADPSRPVHYEDAIRIKGWNDGGRHGTDVVCPMYPTIEEIAAYGDAVATGAADRPLILCEYSHAMGNSNGSLADYWDVIMSTPGLQGGFIWEWKDHGLRQGLPDGSTRLAYGGQFGEEPHDGNFVADGVMSADLVPHPAAQEVAWVHRPVAIDLVSGGIQISNRRAFTDLADLAAHWVLTVSGHVAASGDVAVPQVGPGQQVVVPLPEGAAQVHNAHSAHDAGPAHLSVTWTQREASWYAPAGFALAWDQVCLRDAVGAPADPSPERRHIPDGTLSEPVPHIWRAATDNDGFKLLTEIEVHAIGSPSLNRWRDLGIDHRPAAEIIGYSRTTRDLNPGYEVTHTFDVQHEDLPRVGVLFTVDPAFDEIHWNGAGPHENYPDRNRSATIGAWASAVERSPYLVPQEFGLRTETTRLDLIDSTTGQRLRITTLGDPFCWSATRHTPSALFAAANDSDLVEDERLVVCLDAAHRGLGTGSCGPDVLPAYRIGVGTYELAYRVEYLDADNAG